MMVQVLPTTDGLEPEYVHIGQVVYETDHDRHVVWAGDRWLEVKFDHIVRTQSDLDNGPEVCIDVTATVLPHQ